MESYGTIDERSAATPKKLVGRRIIAAVAAVALVVGASAALSVNRLPGLRAGPQGSLREAVQRPHGLHGLVPEVPQRASYDDVLQVLSGVLGPRPLIDRHEGRPPSFSVSIA